jgi:hypothetical protein
VLITTNGVSSNNVHGEVHSIQHYVIKFVSHFRPAGGFLRVLPIMIMGEIMIMSEVMVMNEIVIVNIKRLLQLYFSSFNGG